MARFFVVTSKTTSFTKIISIFQQQWVTKKHWKDVLLHIPNCIFFFGRNGDPPNINYCRIIAPQFGRTERARIQHSSCMQCNVEQFHVLSLGALKGKYTATIGIFSQNIGFFTNICPCLIQRNISFRIICCTLLKDTFHRTWQFPKVQFHLATLGLLLFCPMICPFYCLIHSHIKVDKIG